MLLIIGSGKDMSTLRVIDWLRYFNHPYLFLHEGTYIDDIHVDFSSEKSSIRFKVASGNYRASDFSKCWIRRGEMKHGNINIW